MAAENKAASKDERTVVITRTFDAPRELVFKMWTDAKHLTRWWGPRHFDTPVCEVDARPGGAIKMVMRGPGMEHAMGGEFIEILEPQRLVFTTFPLDADGKHHLDALITVTFEDVGGKTKLTLLAHGIGRTDVSKFMLEGMEAGWSQSLDRLAEQLSNGSGVAEFVTSHVFDASRDLVYKAWTDPRHMQKWWGPKGCIVLRGENDLRPGGVFHYCMRTPNGQDMWGKWVYREVEPPRRLLFVSSFCDEKGNITRHPLSESWPLEMLTTVTFDEHQGKTMLTIRWVPINASKAEEQTFEAGRESMKQGWAGTFEQQAEYLAKQ